MGQERGIEAFRPGTSLYVVRWYGGKNNYEPQGAPEKAQSGGLSARPETVLSQKQMSQEEGPQVRAREVPSRD